MIEADLLVSLDDVIGTLNHQNMPGTVDTHHNWIQKMQVTIEVIKKDGRLKSLSKILNKYINI
jgi:4-alpha-glucanotransferase